MKYVHMAISMLILSLFFLPALLFIWYDLKKKRKYKRCQDSVWIPEGGDFENIIEGQEFPFIETFGKEDKEGVAEIC